MHVITVSVLAVLPTFGLVAQEPPEDRELTGNPWQDMDYGPFLSAAIEVEPDNIACKGIAIPLVEDGSIAALFDTAELRWAAGWEGDFVELRGIVYDGPHGIWPRIDGEATWTNPTGPGIDVTSGGLNVTSGGATVKSGGLVVSSKCPNSLQRADAGRSATWPAF